MSVHKSEQTLDPFIENPTDVDKSCIGEVHLSALSLGLFSHLPPDSCGTHLLLSPEVPVRLNDLRKWFHTRLPNALVSRAFGQVSEHHFPSKIQGKINRGFARYAKINTNEAAHPPEFYNTLGEFFARKLKEGVRTICEDEGALVSPVDGVITQHGLIPKNGRISQIKDRDYGLAELLGSEEDAQRFAGGSYATLYLSPRDYHRIHAPVAGMITTMRHIPGQLLPVNAFAVSNFDELFPQNERLISFLTMEDGRRIAVVKVGATCVGKISVVYDTLTTNHADRRRLLTRHYDSPQSVDKGGELGAFHLGSTVVLLMEGEGFKFDATIAPDDPIRLGQRLGVWEK